MQPILNRIVRSIRLRFGRFSFPVMALGLCALIFPAQQAALGQAQMGSAETCFDGGPDKLPAVPHASVPALRAEMPAQIAQILQPLHSAASVPAPRPAHSTTQNALPKDRLIPRKKPPEGTLTAAR
jgi:hypothetical protein